MGERKKQITLDNCCENIVIPQKVTEETIPSSKEAKSYYRQRGFNLI